MNPSTDARPDIVIPHLGRLLARSAAVRPKHPAVEDERGRWMTYAELDRAADRVAAGTYGTCERCGTLIAPARLEARPSAATCIDCAGRR